MSATHNQLTAPGDNASRPSTPLATAPNPSPPAAIPFPRERRVSSSLAKPIRRSPSPAILPHTSTISPRTPSSRCSSLLISPSLSLASDMSFDEEGIPHFASSPRESHSRKHSRSEQGSFASSLGGEEAAFRALGVPDSAGLPHGVVEDPPSPLDNANNTNNFGGSEACRQHHHRATSVDSHAQGSPPILRSSSRKSSTSSIVSLSSQGPTDPKARALLETAMRRAEEESENISVNLLRRLSAAEKKANERSASADAGVCSDEEEGQNTRDAMMDFTALSSLSETSVPVRHRSPRPLLGNLLTSTNQLTAPTVNTPVAPQLSFETLNAQQPQGGQGQERVPLTPRVRQVTFDSPAAKGDNSSPDQSKDSELSQDIHLEAFKTNPRRWSMASDVPRSGGKLSTPSDSSWPRGGGRGSSLPGSSPPSPMPHRRRPGTPVPPATLQPSSGVPLRSPLTPLAPLEEERRRQYDDLQAWRIWGLDMWKIAKMLKKRVAELEEQIAKQGHCGEAARAETSFGVSCTLGDAGSKRCTATDQNPCSWRQTGNLGSIDIPPPPMMATPHLLRAASPGGLPLYHDTVTPARLLQRPVTRPLATPASLFPGVPRSSSTGSFTPSRQASFLPPSLAISRMLSPSNATGPRSPLKECTKLESSTEDSSLLSSDSARKSLMSASSLDSDAIGDTLSEVTEGELVDEEPRSPWGSDQKMLESSDL